MHKGKTMKTKNIIIVLSVFFAVAITITSCEYKFVEPIEIELPDDPISFSVQIEPVFQEKCITCHASTSPVLTTGNAYSSLINGNYINTEAPEDSELYKKVSEGHPGSNSLSAEELALLLKWIEEGAEDN